jgi:hypothetical protein
MCGFRFFPTARNRAGRSKTGRPVPARWRPIVLALLTCCFLPACGLFLTCGPKDQPSPQGVVLTGLPKTVDPSGHYVFYLHGQIVEDKGPRPEHAQLGIYEYEAIRDTLASRGLIVISEARPADTDMWTYAQKLIGQIENLLAAGLEPERITVAGHSKGGAIAILVSSLLQNDRINYVFLACCGDWMIANPRINLRGRILSIYDIGDEFAFPCQRAFQHTPHPLDAREIEIDTGWGHGAFYRPMEEWLEPMLKWMEE